MNIFNILCLFCFIVYCFALLDPSGIQISSLNPISYKNRADEDVCGTAQMNFYWGSSYARTPRFAEIYFYYNGSFHDNSYDYDGTWVNFGENGDNILVFDYPSAKYISPNNSGAGSMISHDVCGYWNFDNFKWGCPNICSA